MTAMPADLPRAVHTALRNWYNASQESEPWQGMLAIAQYLARQAEPDLDLAVKEFVGQGLNQLQQEADDEFKEVLRMRFLDKQTATATANRLNLTEDVVYKRQRDAIAALAAILWQSELEARSQRLDHLADRLEIQNPPRLFGVADKLDELVGVLASQDEGWLIAVVGIGGIGKTSLADAAVRALAITPTFADIAWVSARQEHFTLWNGLQENEGDVPALTPEGLADSLAEQLGFRDLTRLPPSQKWSGLRHRLKAQPYLVVVDNLETAADYRGLVPEIQGLVRPTRFLLTSRRSLHRFPDVYNLSLDELSPADSLALLRHEASQRGLTDVAAAPDEKLMRVYQAAGGNPLALKLLAGQMYSLSLTQVVDDLRQARGKTVEELYRHIYWRSWQILDDEARRTLAIMPLIAESGGNLAQISALSELSDEALAQALQWLISLSLVNVRGTIEARRYGIHRLTETFLLNEVLKWQAGS